MPDVLEDQRPSIKSARVSPCNRQRTGGLGVRHLTSSTPDSAFPGSESCQVSGIAGEALRSPAAEQEVQGLAAEEVEVLHEVIVLR